MHDNRENNPYDYVVWKPLRYLMTQGKPIGPTTILLYDLGPHARYPFVSMLKGRNRIVAWLPTADRGNAEAWDGRTFPVDHLTLELSSGVSHLTSHNPNNTREHESVGWELLPYPAAGVSLWFMFATERRFIERQASESGQTVRMPKRDEARRTQAFADYGAQLAMIPTNTPPLRSGALATAIYVVHDRAALQASECRQLFPPEREWGDWIDGELSPDNRITVGATSVIIGDIELLVLTVAPTGSLRGDYFYFGGPT